MSVTGAASSFRASCLSNAGDVTCPSLCLGRSSLAAGGGAARAIAPEQVRFVVIRELDSSLSVRGPVDVHDGRVRGVTESEHMADLVTGNVLDVNFGGAHIHEIVASEPDVPFLRFAETAASPG